jgi:glycosyltransferase involved in cell wall biosynthesis
VLISVVITAHNRQQYLIDAVKSVLNQEIDRNAFEILVVKNFKEERMDNFLSDKGVRLFYTEQKSFGAKLGIGIENAGGEIISFLDDDDTFFPMKLSRVAEIFADASINYMHNSVVAINDAGKVFVKGFSENIKNQIVVDSNKLSAFESELTRFKLDWYVSAMSCRKSVLLERLDLIKNSNASLDRVLFFISSSKYGNLFFENVPLTYYRIHESTTVIFSDFKKYVHNKDDFYLRSATVIENLYKNLLSPNLGKILESELLHSELMAFFYSGGGYKHISLYYVGYAIRLAIRRKNTPLLLWSVLSILRKYFYLVPVFFIYVTSVHRSLSYSRPM